MARTDHKKKKIAFPLLALRLFGGKNLLKKQANHLRMRMIRILPVIRICEFQPPQLVLTSQKDENASHYSATVSAYFTIYIILQIVTA